MTDATRFFPLTNAQKSIWHIAKFYPETTFINIAGIVRIGEPVQYDLLNKAINIAIQQNDAMRTRIVENGKEPEQYFNDYSEQSFEFLDFAYPNGLADLRRWEDSRSRRRMKMLNSDLYDFVLIKIGDAEGAFFIKCHHIVIDAWSMTLITRQILQSYCKLRDHEPVTYIEQPSYRDHILSEVEYCHSEKFVKHGTFWNEKFSTIPEFTTVKKRTVLNRTEAARNSYILSNNLTLLINKVSSQFVISPFCIFFAALTVCIWKLTSMTDIVIGTPVANRSGVSEKSTLGMFISHVPFRVKLDPKLDFASFVKGVGREWKTLLRHQRYPFDLVLKAYRETHGISDKLVDVELSFQNAKLQVQDIDFNTQWLFNGSELNALAIHVNDREDTGNYTIDYDYLIDVFSDSEISRLHEYFATLLNNALVNPFWKISDLSILSPEQENKLLGEFNNTKYDFPKEKSIIALFERQVELTPDKVAVIFENTTVSYRELNERSNQLAKFLHSNGVSTDTIVGLIVDRSIEMIVAILAVLKAGGAYLPIDPTYPVDRIDYMLKDSNCQLVLTYILDSSKNLKFEVRTFDLDDQNLYKGSVTNFEHGPLPSDLVCVIYTSGSTGTPKGVMVENKSLTNLVFSFANIIKPYEKAAIAISSFSFDMFFVETIFPLLTQMKVILANQQEATVPYLLLNLIDRYKVNFLQTTPSRMKLILNDIHAHKLGSLTDIIIGGENFPEQLLSELSTVINAKIFNGYGPTEATICSTIKHVTNIDNITIGKPIANVQVYILDEHMRPVPIGAKGEIYISGEGLARGYINNSVLTKQRFIPNPFAKDSRMYKTGDIARWLSNGEIEYLGRNDNQVKIRGFRIELGEIETCLLKHQKINEVVVVSKEDRNAKKYLCAYLTTRDNVSLHNLREYVLRFLPEYMVPAYFVVVDSLPLTSNGKVDRQALPEPVKQTEQEHNYVVPRNSIEQRLVQLWQEVLNLPKVGIDDNLFVLGGDSLSILEILSGLFPNDLGLSAQDFYNYPTIRRLSDKISGGGSELAEPTVQPIETIKPAPLHRTIDEEIGNILLTGATGFLGSHILCELLTVTSAKIYCLVRGKKPEKRLQALLKFYFPMLSNSKLDKRLVIINGDLTKKNCGLTEREYLRLTEEVSTVIHTAALVKHYGNYEEFYRLNVAATQEMVKFCVEHGKKLNYISTTSVAGSCLTNNTSNTKFTENNLYNGQDYQSNVYVRSKFEAESLITNALAEGLDATTFRVGLLTGRYVDGKFQKNIEQNAFYRLLKSLVMLGAVPIDIIHEQLEFTPVDCCAKAIVKIITSHHANLERFHVFNHKTIQMTEVIRFFAHAGMRMKVLQNSEFNSLLTSISKTDHGKEILSGIITAPCFNGAVGSLASVHVDSSLSIEFLRKKGFIWPDITNEYLLKVLHYMQETGFINNQIPSVS